MQNGLVVMLVTAATVAFFHTLLGPDHYIPFAAMAQARSWGKGKTLLITTLCGIGHVVSSVLLGLMGILAGVSLVRLKFIESMRGEIAAWLLIAFGMTYFVWAMMRTARGKDHHHHHVHHDQQAHEHSHTHQQEHMHVHAQKNKSLTPWVLFIIFFFGPCEPLIPLVMYPALKSQWHEVALVVGVFSAVTLVTMVGMVVLALNGLNLLRFNLEKHFHALAGFSHAIGGFVVLVCGVAIKYFAL